MFTLRCRATGAKEETETARPKKGRNKTRSVKNENNNKSTCLQNLGLQSSELTIPGDQGEYLSGGRRRRPKRDVGNCGNGTAGGTKGLVRTDKLDGSDGLE